MAAVTHYTCDISGVVDTKPEDFITVTISLRSVQGKTGGSKTLLLCQAECLRLGLPLEQWRTPPPTEVSLEDQLRELFGALLANTIAEYAEDAVRNRS